MGSKIVYRTLRKISDWTLDGFYSEVYVSGEDNVPLDGPLIVTPCHHNEILDIATLSVAMPHGRPVCFWAKSTMFGNPLTKAILSSSGSIPVRRNPNSASNGHMGGESGNGSRLELFRETFHALDADEIIGVFPEGTSYTEPQIAQIKDGAAWAALEYARWQIQNSSKYAQGPKRLYVIPVGIVYTDKTRFQSRVIVQFGEPIDVETYARRHLSSTDPRLEVRKLSNEIERRLFELTVNATNWDHLFAASIARDIVYKDIPAKAFVETSQFFVNRLQEDGDTKTLELLVKYYALLHHAGTSHKTLTNLYPEHSAPTPMQSFIRFTRELLTTALHPRALCYLPVGVIHIPSYLTGSVAGKFLATPGEPETLAEFKSVFGGLAFGVTSAVIGKNIAGALFRNLSTVVQSGPDSHLPEWFTNVAARLFDLSYSSPLGSLPRIVGTTAVIYWTTWALFRWHRALVLWNYNQFHRTLTSWKILIGMLFPPSRSLSAQELKALSRPPLPKPNPFIKRRTDEPITPAQATEHTPRAHMRDLLIPLLAARAGAVQAVHELFADRKSAQ